MAKKRTCMINGCDNPPELPDRNRMGRPIKRICRECHAGQLRGDLRHVMALRAKHKRNNADD